jgi:hypothetical protein
VLNWRHKGRFPKLHEAWDWLGEMLERNVAGVPPVGESEFADLAEWFEANRERLYLRRLVLVCQGVDAEQYADCAIGGTESSSVSPCGSDCPTWASFFRLL